MASYLIHFNPNHDKLGRFTFKTSENSMRSKKKNYMDTVSSLSKEEFGLFTNGGSYDKKTETKWLNDYTKAVKNNQNAMVFVSKYGNVTLAGLNSADKEWEIGWATNPKSRGTGVTQANIKEAISMVREVSDLPISAIIEKQNIASQKTAEKAGFKSVGYTTVDGTKRKKYTYN